MKLFFICVLFVIGMDVVTGFVQGLWLEAVTCRQVFSNEDAKIGFPGQWLGCKVRGL